jgi:ferredoxin/Na+-translocating ferredoxin:NAD+ oxidoreductase RnfG subunit
MPPPFLQLSRAAAGVLVCLLALAFGVDGVLAQRVKRIPWSVVEEVMPGADRFSDAAGNPPVISGYRAGPDGEEVLHGYVFLTSDLPPEQYGYSGPIEVLVGMTPGGTLTGVRVTDYRESYMRSMGDFLKAPGFQEQFAGKYIGDPFRLWGDIEGISRVSITVRAMSRGVRDSARRVAAAYGGMPDIVAAAGEVPDPIGRSWFELRQLGIVRRFEVTEPGEGSAGIAVAHISSDRIGEYFFGAALYERAVRAVERRGGADNLMLYSVDGSRLRLFRQQGWSVEQDGDTIEIDPGNIVMLGLPSGGVVSGEATMVGLMLIDRAVDMSRPFTFVYDLGDLGVYTLEYVTQEARTLIAEAETEAAAQAAVATALAEAALLAEARRAAAEATEPDTSDSDTTPVETRPVEEPEPDGPTAEDEPAPEVSVAPTVSQEFDFVLTEDETLWARMLADTSWARVAMMLAVLSLASAAFFLKRRALRWVALSVTLVVLGFVDGGFLSVSHITSGIWAGPGVYLRDLPLLLIVVYTVVTTLVWGRVFCGFLCPFGALQDVIDRVVPRRFKRPLPRGLHDRASYVKYGVLAIIVIPALAGSHVSLYQYFEPFGTVFFRSPSLLLWAIAGAFLAASVVIPRFYCRYACPLGAALGIVSLISLKRINRVEQCGHCKVCEQKCPTGAIRGATIDFKECVRCNVCEIELIERTGVCRHDMEYVRARLVQLEVGAGVGVTDD